MDNKTHEHILLVEDEENISNSLKIILEAEGFTVSVCATGACGISRFQQADLLVLDLMLPDMSGLEVLNRIRKESSTYPVLIVSAKNTEQDLVTGLISGADDYITKPFSVQELILRIRRTLERKRNYERLAKDPLALKEYSFGKNNVINFETLQAKTNHGIIQLTRQESDILLFLINKKSTIVSRGELIKHIWGHHHDYESRTVDNFIVRFRKYFEENPKWPKHFVTKRGIGYIFSE